jgi:aryl-alcohol dehydrogenase-like predicted oxidoreductase
MKLKKETFGQTDRRVSELCLSTSNFSRYASHEESFAILDCFREAGGNFIQTGGICPGVSLGDGFLGIPEEVLGRWLRRQRVDRSSIIIATRFALTRPVIGGLATYTELIRHCVEDSIRRIDCGYLDFLVAEWTDALVPIAESIAAFEAVIASRKVTHVIPANFPIARVIEGLAAALDEPATIAGLQLDYSLAAPLALKGGAARLSADYELGVIARSPPGGGHLARHGIGNALGAWRDRVTSVYRPAIAAGSIWPVLSTIARRRRFSPAQIALSWVLSHPQITSVVVSVSTVNELRELFAAWRLQLSSEEIARLSGRPIRRMAPSSRPKINLIEQL